MSPMSGVLIFVISIVALPSIDSITLSSENHCVTNSDCQSSSCCVIGPSRCTKPSCMPFQQKSEQCRPNAETITGNFSYPDNSQIKVTGVHYILCPCADGLSCNPILGICN